MPIVQVKDFQINYEITCDIEGPTLLLVPGFGEQIDSVEYPKEQCHLFADHGFRVVRMENRDSGFSLPTVANEQVQSYSLKQTADDVAAVINDIGGAVHLIGASLGGFIARWAAIRHPYKIQTLTVVMSGSGAEPQENGPQMSKKAAGKVSGYLQRRSRDEQIAWNLAIWRWIWGNGYPFPAEWVRDCLGRAFDRSYNPEGNVRLLNALVSTPGLWDAQKAILCPTLVMHGGEDPIFSKEHGEAVAERIPNAELWLDQKMGHIMHQEQWEEMASRVEKLSGLKYR